ncbi:(4Fe-4S)-binding protein [Croceiramulus getboli]|nr:(4Fe-4S)-binding protein [Flavobacteriaceae bacterium YJPT1-3]
MATVKEYSNGEITILWKPDKCIHAAECVKMLPEVYRPNEKPWIQIENATTAALKIQVGKCPSGALSLKNQEAINPDPSPHTVQIEVMDRGPLMVMGTLEVKDHNGTVTTQKRATAFCRCGASSRKPYCDGSHSEIEFSNE